MPTRYGNTWSLTYRRSRDDTTVLRLGIDATPLLGSPTGIGRYTKGLLDTLANPGETTDELDIVATAFASCGPAPLRPLVPASVRVRGSRIPAVALQNSWRWTRQPRITRLCGAVDVFHATNFVLPALGHTAGVLSVHDLSFLRYPQTVTKATLRYRSLVPRGIARATLVFALTEAVAQEIAAEYRVERERIVVVPPGIDEAWLQATGADDTTLQRLGLPAEFILAVGSLEPRKNLPALITAHQRLRSSDASTPPLVLAGPAGWGPALQLDELPAGSVYTTGYLNDELLRGLVASARCLAFPSRYEGFGLPVVEALACATPVVATDLPVIREVAGEQATYVPDGDIDALADGITRALHQPRDRNADAARRSQAAQWTWTRTAQEALAGYRRASCDVQGGWSGG